MGCGLQKLAKQDENSPGKIFSTLKRPQVETKTGTSYEYRFLDFTTLNNEVMGSSAVRLSSLHDLQVQLQELYQQGFVLAAVHPFVQPIDGKERTPQEQFFRAVLIKQRERFENVEDFSLEIELCSSSDQLPGIKMMADFIKKVQEAAGQGCKFVGFIHQFSSKEKPVGTPSDKSVPEAEDDNKNTSNKVEDSATLNLETEDLANRCDTQKQSEDQVGQPEDQRGEEVVKCKNQVTDQPGTPPPRENGGQLLTESSDNTAGLNKVPDKQRGLLKEHSAGLPRESIEIFAIFNKTNSDQHPSRYYTVSIPLKISRNGQSVSSMEANWLSHMTDHFKKGGSLVNGVVHLGMVNDSLPSSTEGLFIFENDCEKEPKTTHGYDAIVVEQWTVIEGVEVKTDYIPLLNSLAAYGWQLTCILPTPIVKTNREGYLATKQIVFLQRPYLPRKEKKKESKKRSFKEGKQRNHSKVLAKKESAKSKRNDPHPIELEQVEKTPDSELSHTNDETKAIADSPQKNAADSSEEGKQEADNQVETVAALHEELADKEQEPVSMPTVGVEDKSAEKSSQMTDVSGTNDGGDIE
nr:PREDICTED: raftlin [Latimeria chalumnae]XP_014347977.1 PREDICTED: raftlin [Latimeria chalumnae]|eukprot:XP_014347976.1 PREDICTED: raftlin [Latimeria chalumnae]